MEVEVKKLYDSAVLPTRGSEYAAGLDLYACGYEGNMTDGTDWSVFVNPGDKIKINTGIAIAIPDGYFGGVYARSGLACKNGLAPANKVGVIDADYRGELIVCLYNQSSVPQKIAKDDRVAQLIIQPYLPVNLKLVDELDETVRGDGGFGSTGINTLENSYTTHEINLNLGFDSLNVKDLDTIKDNLENKNLDFLKDLEDGKLCFES